MQLIQLERDDWNFFCPATGEPVFKETGEPNASTVRGFWCHEVPDEPELLCDELQPQWAAHVAIQDALGGLRDHQLRLCLWPCEQHDLDGA